jgi:hypothetical protein
MTDFGDIKSFKTREDFTLESRHLICIANKDYINKNLIILFYKKGDKKDKTIYDIFSKVGNNLKIVNLNFASCAVDQIHGLEKTFQEIANDTDHPYHWIRNRPRNEDKDSELGSVFRFPFMLVYRKGFPQGFYEGSLDEKEFREFCIQLAVKPDFGQLLSTDSKEISKQQWMEYRAKTKDDVKEKTGNDTFNMVDYSDKGKFEQLMSSFYPFSPKIQ